MKFLSWDQTRQATRVMGLGDVVPTGQAQEADGCVAQGGLRRATPVTRIGNVTRKPNSWTYSHKVVAYAGNTSTTHRVESDVRKFAERGFDNQGLVGAD